MLQDDTQNCETHEDVSLWQKGINDSKAPDNLKQ